MSYSQCGPQEDSCGISAAVQLNGIRLEASLGSAQSFLINNSGHILFREEDNIALNAAQLAEIERKMREGLMGLLH